MDLFDIAVASKLAGGGGGGGASNIVTGTFKMTDTEGSANIDIPYTGNGYPILAVFYPVGGMKANTDWLALTQANAVGFFVALKDDMSNAPDYSSDDGKNYAWTAARYKASVGDPSNIALEQRGDSYRVYRDSRAWSGIANCVYIRKKDQLAINFTDGRNSTKGFARSIEYAYIIVYSE